MQTKPVLAVAGLSFLGVVGRYSFKFGPDTTNTHRSIACRHSSKDGVPSFRPASLPMIVLISPRVVVLLISLSMSCTVCSVGVILGWVGLGASETHDGLCMLQTGCVMWTQVSSSQT